MKIKINNYILEDKQIKTKKKILLMSDIHSNIEDLTNIEKIIEKIKPDFILIPGDTIDNSYDKDNNKIITILKKISKISDIYISLGNHEMYGKDKKTYSAEYKKFFKKLKNKNIHLMIDEFSKETLEDIDIYAVNLPLDYYNEEENENYLKKILIENSPEDKFNILLIHSSNKIIKDNINTSYTFIDKMNLIVSGHNHGGLIPTPVQDKLNNHIGLAGPYRTLFPKNSYGIYNKDNTSLIISNGVTKISKMNELGKIGEIVNKILVPEIDIINIEPSDKHKLKLISRKNYKF